MGKRHNPNGKRFRPLNKSEIEQYDEAARDSSDPLTELAARTLLYTGLRNGELSHLRGNWLTGVNEGDHGVLRVPGEEECIGGAGAVGRSSSVGKRSRERNAGCYTCRNTRDGQWEPKTQTAIREIPIVEEEVYELLESWFKIHEQVPLLHGAVGARVNHVAERAGLSRQVKPHDLRHTYETMLARRGTNDGTIAAVMGYNSPNKVTHHLRISDVTEEFEGKWNDEDGSDSDEN